MRISKSSNLLPNPSIFSSPKQLSVAYVKMPLNVEEITQQIQQLALQHKAGTEYKSENGKVSASESDVDKLMSEFKTKMTLEESKPPGESPEESDTEVDPSHTFSDLAFFVDRFRRGAMDAHLAAADLRNWFEKRSMPEHYNVTAKIALDLCLRRVDAKVIAKQAEDHCETQSAAVKTEEDKKKLRRLYEKAEVGYTNLWQVEADLWEVFSVCLGCEDYSNNTIWDDILGELVRISNGGKEKRPEWMEGWPFLA